VNDTSIVFFYKKEGSTLNSYIPSQSVTGYQWTSEQIEKPKTEPRRDTLARFSHAVGGGPQFVIALGDQDYQSTLKYQTPRPFLFYRATYNHNKKHKLLFQASVFERKGQGTITEGGRGSGSYYQGSFDSYYAELSIDKGWAFGPAYNGLFLLGVNFAGLVHYSGFLTDPPYLNHVSYQMKEANIKRMINDALLGIHVEMSGRIRTGPGWILLGLRCFYGGGDALKTKASAGLVAITGYQFGKG
jgi:hypothetical protein